MLTLQEGRPVSGPTDAMSRPRSSINAIKMVLSLQNCRQRTSRHNDAAFCSLRRKLQGLSCKRLIPSRYFVVFLFSRCIHKLSFDRRFEGALKSSLTASWRMHHPDNFPSIGDHARFHANRRRQ